MKRIPALSLLAALVCTSPPAVADNEPWRSDFVPPPDEYSWVQLDTGEWLKGEIIAIYDDKLTFDSDHFDKLSIDLEDVETIHGQGIFVISVQESRPVTGEFQIRGQRILVTAGDHSEDFDRDSLVSITRLAKQERDRWTGDVDIGLNMQEGNSDIWDYSVGAKLQRRTPVSRWTFEYIGNKNEVEGERVSDSHRLTVAADRFTGRRLFWRPVSSQYFRDEIQNIKHQATVDTGFGYNLVDTRRTTWELQAGVGGNYLENVSVEEGEANGEWSPVGTFGSDLDIELTSWLDYELLVKMWFLEENAGKYQHQVVTTLSSDLIGDLDLDISLHWNRTENPQAAEDGTIPEQDDYRLQVSLSYEF